MSRAERLRAIRMMEADPKRDLYEGGGPKGEGSGKFYVSFSANEGTPELDREDIRILIEEGNIKEKWPSCYVLT